MKKWRILPILAFSLVLCIAASGLLAAQTPTPTSTPTPNQAKIEGKITSIDLQTNKVTITPPQQPAITLVIVASTKIEVWGKDPAALADLKVGHGIEATYSTGTLEVISIEAKQRGEPSKGAKQGFFGTVKSLAANSITLDTKQGAVTFMVNSDTEYWNPPKKDVTLSDVKPGDRVAVLAEKTDTALVAKRVLVIPTKPTHQQIKGVVTKISGTEITLTYDTDKTIVANASPGVAKKIELGDLITAVIIKTPGVEKVLIQDVESSSKLLERLQRQAEKKTGKEKDEVNQLIERNQQKHQEVLQRVLDKAPVAAKSAIQKVLEKSKAKGKAPEAPGKTPQAPGKAR